jgi:hypothetical protein
MNPPELELEDDPLPNRRRRSDPPPFRSSNTSGLSEFIVVTSSIVVVRIFFRIWKLFSIELLSFELRLKQINFVVA